MRDEGLIKVEGRGEGKIFKKKLNTNKYSRNTFIQYNEEDILREWLNQNLEELLRIFIIIINTVKN